MHLSAHSDIELSLRMVVRGLALTWLAVAWLSACGNTNSGSGTNTGGQSSPPITSGGNTGAGGTANSGGSSTTGGQVGTGGKATGGSSGIGGHLGSGGETGFAGSGGTAIGSGGTTFSSGTVGSGGRISTGGQTSGMGSGGGPAATGGAPGSGGAGLGGNAIGGAGGGAGAGGSKADAAVPPIDSGSSGGSSGTCPATVMKSGDSTQKVGSRSYILHVPTGYTGTKPIPLVVDFHALGGTGSQQKSLSGWDKKGDSVGFLTAFPDSASNGGNGWNVGMCCQDAQKNKVDDAGFVRDMIKAIEGMACVDPKRIFVSGCSNGGGMSYKTACELADIVAAAAPVDFRCVVGGTTASPSCDGCKPARPISIIHFDNTGDTSLVPYNGGMTSFAADCPANSSCTGMGFPSAAANFSTWQQLDQCTGSVAPNPGACATNSACQGGTQVTICVQQGGSHCGNYGTLKIVDTAWTEFAKLSMP